MSAQLKSCQRFFFEKLHTLRKLGIYEIGIFKGVIDL